MAIVVVFFGFFIFFCVSFMVVVVSVLEVFFSFFIKSFSRLLLV